MERSTRDDTRFGPKRDIFDRDDDRRSSPYRNEAEPRRNFFSRDDDRRSSPNRNETETRREFFRRDDSGRPSRQETTETVSIFDMNSENEEKEDNIFSFRTTASSLAKKNSKLN